MENIKLTQADFIDLSELIVKTNIEQINLKPIEVKLIFKLDKPATDLSEFYWNVNAGYIKGRIANKNYIFPPKLLAEDFIDDYQWHPNVVIASVLNYIEQNLTSPALLEKIQSTLSEKYDYLSLGQAKSIIKRKLRLSLTSAERNDLSRLRKKFDGYRKLILAFEDMVDKKTVKNTKYQNSEFLPYNREYLSSFQSQLKFMCWICKTYLEFPDTSEPVIPPLHHEKPMTLNWGSKLSADEIMEIQQELQNAVHPDWTGLEAIEANTLKNSDKKELLISINAAKLKLGRLLEDDDPASHKNNLILKAKSILTTIDVEEHTRFNISKYLKDFDLVLSELESNSQMSDDQVREILSIRAIFFDAQGFLGFSGFDPQLAKKLLKPISKNKKKIEVHHIDYYCTICKQSFDIPKDKERKLLNSDSADKEDHPLHCNKKMELRLSGNKMDDKKIEN